MRTRGGAGDLPLRGGPGVGVGCGQPGSEGPWPAEGVLRDHPPPPPPRLLPTPSCPLYTTPPPPGPLHRERKLQAGEEAFRPWWFPGSHCPPWLGKPSKWTPGWPWCPGVGGLWTSGGEKFPLFLGPEWQVLSKWGPAPSCTEGHLGFHKVAGNPQSDPRSALLPERLLLGKSGRAPSHPASHAQELRSGSGGVCSPAPYSQAGTSQDWVG